MSFETNSNQFFEITSTNCTAITVKTSIFNPKMPSQMICRSLFNPKCFTPVPPSVSDRWGAPAMLHISLLLMLLWGYKKLTPFIPWLVVIYVLPLSWCRKKPLFIMSIFYSPPHPLEHRKLIYPFDFFLTFSDLLFFILSQSIYWMQVLQTFAMSQ